MHRLRHRGYAGPADVGLLQAFNSAAVAESGYVGHLHVGEIPHRMFNGLRFDDLSEMLHIWEDASGAIAAWGLVSASKYAAFELQVRPDLRSAELERGLVAFLHSATEEVCVARGAGHDRIEIEVSEGDGRRTAAVVANGYTMSDEWYFVTARELGGPPEVVLPVGYVIRAAVGVEDAAGLAAVHASSFGSEWTAERYEWLMTTPGYDPQRELIAVAPDGTFAAFTVMWHDMRNGTGLFEPVGTHAEHRRLGLGRAMLCAGMQRMAQAGLHTAMVVHESDNEGSTALYASLGFEAIDRSAVWTRPM